MSSLQAWDISLITDIYVIFSHNNNNPQLIRRSEIYQIINTKVVHLKVEEFTIDEIESIKHRLNFHGQTIKVIFYVSGHFIDNCSHQSFTYSIPQIHAYLEGPNINKIQIHSTNGIGSEQ
jgi:hypothetical protein